MREAEAELNAARDLFAHGHWSWCCFTSQQAAEKALKALSEHFRSPQAGPNLNLLVRALEPDVSISEGVRQSCAHLNRYYIPTRYPNAFDRGVPAEQFFEADARQALDHAKEVAGFARGIIGSP